MAFAVVGALSEPGRGRELRMFSVNRASAGAIINLLVVWGAAASPVVPGQQAGSSGASAQHSIVSVPSLQASHGEPLLSQAGQSDLTAPVILLPTDAAPHSWYIAVVPDTGMTGGTVAAVEVLSLDSTLVTGWQIGRSNNQVLATPTPDSQPGLFVPLPVIGVGTAVIFGAAMYRAGARMLRGHGRG